MSSIFEFIKMEMEMVDEAKYTHSFEKEEVASGETVVGTITPEARKLFAYACSLGEKYDRLKLEAKYDAQRRNELSADLERIKSYEKILHKLFWATVRTELGLWGNSYTGVGLRSGGQVVLLDESGNDVPPSIQGFLDIIKGMGGDL